MDSLVMKTEKYEIKEEIASVCFTKKELLVFRKKTRDGTPFCEINKSKLQGVIYKTAKKTLRNVFISIIGIAFLQIPFITSHHFDFKSTMLLCVFLFIASVYITAKINRVPMGTQFKLVRLGVFLSFTFIRS